MITRSCRRYAAGSASVFACLVALSSAVYGADTHIPVQVNIAGNLGSFQGTTAPKATVFVYEGLDLNKLVAKVETDRDGKFSFAAKPLVPFFDESTGQLKNQAFVSYQIMAFWLDDEGKPQMLHRFQSVRFQPGDVSKEETWSLQLKKMPAGSITPKDPPVVLPVPPTPQGRVVPFDLLQPRVHRVGVGNATPYSQVVPVHWPWEQGFCLLPCRLNKENLGPADTKVGEVHTTAGAANTFKLGISSAVTIDMATSFDKFVTFSLGTGATFSEKLENTWRLLESDTHGVEALMSFRYEKSGWHWDFCYPITWPPYVSCPQWTWEVIQAVEPLTGAKNGVPAAGDNAQPGTINREWNPTPTSPGNGWSREIKNSWYFQGAGGLNLEIFKAKLGVRLDKSVDTKYEVDFDRDKLYDYEEMVSYDGGTNGGIWYFTHRLQQETLTATGQTSNSVKLQWTPFTGLDFARYEIWYQKQGTNAWSLHSAITNKEQTSGEFGRLASGTTYQFYVTVKENSGLYSDTNVVKRKTDSGGGGGGCIRDDCRPKPM